MILRNAYFQLQSLLFSKQAFHQDADGIIVRAPQNVTSCRQEDSVCYNLHHGQVSHWHCYESMKPRDFKARDGLDRQYSNSLASESVDYEQNHID